MASVAAQQPVASLPPPLPFQTTEREASAGRRKPTERSLSERAANGSQQPACDAAGTVPADRMWLFETPDDLVCPITHEIFMDPVINCVGQVYERSSITRHLQQSRTDPITRLPLADTSLTPVFLLRSRAQQYRQSAATACVQAAASPGERHPARYLRRGVEILGGAEGVTVEGLSPSCIEYVASHPAGPDDVVALRIFASGLRAAGLLDEASNVYLHLLLLSRNRDHAAQARNMKRCLDCWPADDSGDLCLAERNLDKLAFLVEELRAFSWSQLLDIVHLANPADDFSRRLCEQLLQRLVGSSGRQGAFQEVLLKYTQLGFRELRAAVEEAKNKGGMAKGEEGGKAGRGGVDEGEEKEGVGGEGGEGEWWPPHCVLCRSCCVGEMWCAALRASFLCSMWCTACSVVLCATVTYCLWCQLYHC